MSKEQKDIKEGVMEYLDSLRVEPYNEKTCQMKLQLLYLGFGEEKVEKEIEIQMEINSWLIGNLC